MSLNIHTGRCAVQVSINLRGQSTEIFGRGGGRREAERLGAPFLGEIPLDPVIRGAGDQGKPVAADAGRPEAAPFEALAAAVARAIGADEPPPDASSGGLFERFRNLWPGSGTT